MKILAVLGSTGSIGTNTLDVVRRNRHLYQVYSLVAGHNIEILTAQILEFRPQTRRGRDLRGVDPSDRVSGTRPDCRAPSGRNSGGVTRREWKQYGPPRWIP